MRARHDGRFIMNNYGKGVLFWEADAEAHVFVNDFQDVVSADLYWHTDHGVRDASEGGGCSGGAESSCRRRRTSRPTTAPSSTG